MLFPRLKSESGKVEASDPEDSFDVDLLHPSEFYVAHEATILRVRDVTAWLVYVLVPFLLVMSLYIKAQTGAFPFNVDPVARSIYWENSKPLLVFSLLSFFLLLAMVLRGSVTDAVENKIGEKLAEKISEKSSTRKLKVKSKLDKSKLDK